MIKTSTLSPSSLQTKKTSDSKEEIKLPDPDSYRDAEPSESCINNILNYSRSLSVFKSELVKEIEVVHT
jgi:hypothetical protein